MPTTVEDGSLVRYHSRKRSLRDRIIYRLTVAREKDVPQSSDESLLYLAIKLGPQHRRMIINCGATVIRGPVDDVHAYFVWDSTGQDIVKHGLATNTIKGGMLNRNGRRMRELLLAHRSDHDVAANQSISTAIPA